MSNSLPNTDDQGREIEVGSVIRYWRTDGWNGGWSVEGVVTEIKPKSYITKQLMPQFGYVGPNERVHYETLSYLDNDIHRVNKEREDRYGRVTRPRLLRTAAEQVAYMAESNAARDRVYAYEAQCQAERQSQREADKAAEQKRRDINDAATEAIEALKERHREEFETLVTVEYRKRNITPSDLDAADAYYSKPFTVRPTGYTSEVTV